MYPGGKRHVSPKVPNRLCQAHRVIAKLLGILPLGVALGGLILTIGGSLRNDIRALGDRLTSLEGGHARIEGLLAGSGLFRFSTPSEVSSGD